MAKEYGYDRWGTTRVHYRPSPETIIKTCQQIREQGYFDVKGHWHDPWDEATEEERRVGCNRKIPVEGLEAISTIHLRSVIEEDGGDWLDYLD